jgi:integration host factor subunit beta
MLRPNTKFGGSRTTAPEGDVDDSWARAELLVDVVFDCMEQSMSRGEEIEVRGFGTFQVRSYRAYKGRNPRTGQVVDVTPKRLPHFKVSTELAARVNGGRRSTEASAAAEPIKSRAPVAT